jgi:FkbM family methyltransferase
MAKFMAAGFTQQSVPKFLKKAILGITRPTHVKLTTVDYFGARFSVFKNDDIGWRLRWRLGFEKNEIRWLLSFLNPEDLFVDVGANFGLYTILAAKALPQGRVVAFEPAPLVGSLLRLNVLLNNLRNVTLRAEALSDGVGQAKFSVAVDSGFSSLRGTERKVTSDILTVDVTSLDVELATMGRAPAVIKIDAEGAEFLIIRGATSTLTDEKKRPRALLVECNDDNLRGYDSSRAQLVQLLTSYGYFPYSIVAGGQLRGGPTTENIAFIWRR